MTTQRIPLQELQAAAQLSGRQYCAFAWRDDMPLHLVRWGVVVCADCGARNLINWPRGSAIPLKVQS